MSFNVQVLHLSYFQTSKPASKFYTITLTQIFFSLGKHFEKEEDVRGIPQESVHFRWVHLLKSSSHNLKIDEERHITCVWIESLKKNLKEHIKISHLKTNNRFKAFKLDFFQVCLSFQLNSSSVFSPLRVSWQMGASDSRWCFGARPVWGWTEDCCAGRAWWWILHHLRGIH